MTSSQVIDELLDDHPGEFIPLDVFIATNGRYVTSWGYDRGFNFYHVQAYPTVWFNGAESVVGSANMYDRYWSAIQRQAALPTDVTVDVAASYQGGRTFEITTTVAVEPGGQGKTLRTSLVEAVDQLGIFDDLVTRPHNTLKQALEPGVDLTVAAGQTLQFTRTLTVDDASWSRLGDVRLIAWAQQPADDGPAEIYNAFQLELADAFRGDYSRNGFTDGGDLLAWQRSDGFAASRGVWETYFGAAAQGAAAQGVPEPASGVLIVVACVTAAACGRSRGKRFGVA
jgi:hypothetical protein